MADTEKQEVDLYIFAQQKLGNPIPEWVNKPSKERSEKIGPALRTLIKRMDKHHIDIILKTKEAKSKRLATWWEENKTAKKAKDETVS